MGFELPLATELDGLVGKTSALDWKRSRVRIPPELYACDFHGTREITEYTVLSLIGRKTFRVKLNSFKKHRNIVIQTG